MGDQPVQGRARRLVTWTMGSSRTSVPEPPLFKKHSLNGDLPATPSACRAAHTLVPPPSDEPGWAGLGDGRAPMADARPRLPVVCSTGTSRRSVTADSGHGGGRGSGGGGPGPLYHDLRRSAYRDMLEAGLDPFTATDIVGPLAKLPVKSDVDLGPLKATRVVDVHGLPLGHDVECGPPSLPMAVARLPDASERELDLGPDRGGVDVRDAGREGLDRPEGAIDIARVDGRGEAVGGGVGDLDGVL